MKNKIIVFALAPLCAFSLSACGLFGQEDQEPQNDPSTAQIDPEDIGGGSNPVNPSTTVLEAPTAKLGDYSVEDLKNANMTAQKYIDSSLSKPELLSGKWWTDGHDMRVLGGIGNFSSGLKREISSLNPETGLGARSSQSVALFLAPSESIKASSECEKSLKNCSSKPFYNNPKWSSVNKKSVQVEVSASVTRDLLKDNNPEKSLDTYRYKIVLSKDKKDWKIFQIQNSYVIGKKVD